uniref:Gastrin/cholecystokinin type B receptor n=1 Tax=Ciona savignyi TaxID=51511 RepID=H2Y5N0_CIOSA
KDVASISLYALVFFMAVTGNILVIITLSLNRRMRTVTNCFLLSLAVSDLLLAVCCMPVSLVGQLLQRFVFGALLCKMIPYLMGKSVSVAASTITMLALSLERYSSICHPLKSRAWQTRKHALKVIGGIWVVSFLLVSPTLFFSNLSNIPIIKAGKCVVACRMTFPSQVANKTWYLFLFVALFCVPGVVMTVAYSKVCWDILNRFKLDSSYRNIADGRLGSSSDYNAGSSNGDGVCVSTPQNPRVPQVTPSSVFNSPASRQEQHERANRALARWRAKKRVIQMFMLIVVLYFVCWSPLYVINIWRAFDPKRAMSALEGHMHIVHLLSYVSTCVNPVVYCFMNKRFRDSFLFVFICC